MAATPVATDFSAYGALRARARTDDAGALRAAAQQFEALFTQMLLKSMRDASFGDDLMSSQQGDFYRDLFDQQVALSMASGQGRGLGIAEMLVHQLSEVGRTPKEVGRTPNASAAVGSPSHFEAKKGSDPFSGFIEKVLPHAGKAARALGIAPHMLIAQSALETGWGTSVAAGANNHFGIKAGESWRGARATVATQEYAGGRPRAELAAFRAYASVAESFDDYAKLVGNAPRYAQVRNAGADSARFAEGLQRAGYATDPAYADKIRRIADDPDFQARVRQAARRHGIEA